MNGQNTTAPPWLGMALRVGGVLIVGTLAYANLSARVAATDLIASDNKVDFVKHEERIDIMEKILIKNSTILENMEKTLDEIKADIREGP